MLPHSAAPAIVISSLGGLNGRQSSSVTKKELYRRGMLRRVLNKQLEGPRGKRFGQFTGSPIPDTGVADLRHNSTGCPPGTHSRSMCHSRSLPYLCDKQLPLYSQPRDTHKWQMDGVAGGWIEAASGRQRRICKTDRASTVGCNGGKTVHKTTPGITQSGMVTTFQDLLHEIRDRRPSPQSECLGADKIPLEGCRSSEKVWWSEGCCLTMDGTLYLRGEGQRRGGDDESMISGGIHYGLSSKTNCLMSATIPEGKTDPCMRETLPAKSSQGAGEGKAFMGGQKEHSCVCDRLPQSRTAGVEAIQLLSGGKKQRQTMSLVGASPSTLMVEEARALERTLPLLQVTPSTLYSPSGLPFSDDECGKVQNTNVYYDCPEEVRVAMVEERDNGSGAAEDWQVGCWSS
ncbi:unnamed protein product [Choristocarpus tenellus]